ncbi:MAG: hypothetical protein AB7E95_11605, partial [Kiritimatiellales bacterium]
ISIKSEIWINGVKVMDETRSNEASSLADLYLTPDDFNIGTARGDMSLGNTDVGVLRVYNRPLTETEIAQNYAAGFSTL